MECQRRSTPVSTAHVCLWADTQEYLDAFYNAALEILNRFFPRWQ